MFPGMRWESKGLCWDGSTWELALSFSTLQGAKLLHFPELGETGGPPWATLGGSSQEKGLQVHREGSTWKQMRMW